MKLFTILYKRTTLLFCVIILLAFTPMMVPPPGLTTPEPIGAYLNGKFPRSINGGGSIDIVPAYPNLLFNAPLSMAVHPRDNKIFIAQRDGQIFYFTDDENTTNKTMFLDLRNEVGAHFDGGFYNMVFHPNFGLPGAQGRNYIYTYYSTPSLTGAHDGPTPQRCKPQALFDGSYLVLRRYEVIDGTLTVDLTKTLDMIKIRLYNSTHRGGGMLFGNDGMLYVIIGDQAQHETAQEMEMSFDGGTLRLDVDMDPTRSHAPTYLMPKDLPRAPDETSGQGYFIPNDNPFVGWANTFEEYYTLGHRNPHRMTIDRQTGKMYIGEVGAGTHEEINIVKKGANYGWPVWEGPARKNVCVSALHPNTTHELPLVAFPRSVANSITGGYVYRGSAIPELAGKYICADYGGGGEIWSVDVNTGIYEQIGTTIGNTTKVISFGEDKSGELYLLAGGNSTALDRSNFEPLYRLVSPGSVDQLPRTLSATEAFSDLQNLTPSSGFVPYEMYESFWSDNALKKRWMMVPNNGSHDTPAEQIEYSENGEWLFPEGTVFIKHFELPIDENNPSITRRLETRFTVVGKDQKVYGVTYKWRADGSDADLLESSFDENIPIQTANGGMRNQSWHYPSFSECLTCHNETVGGTLGPRTRYLNTDFTYPSTGITANQLVTLSSLGMIPESITDASVSSLPKNAKMDEPTASLQTRARSYLDLNCGYCHRPGANNRAVFDARISTPLEASNLFSDRLNQSLGIAGERIIAAGDISRSVLYQRIHSVDPSIMMPPLAKSLIDEEGTALIAEWIGNLPADLDADDCIISNLALNKSTQQSSTYPGAVSSRAVDGNTNGEWAAGSVANTQDEANPWWEVDLGDTYFMHSVKVWSRINCCQDRLSDFYVISSAVPFTSQDLTATLNQPGVKVHRVEKTVIGGFEIPWLDEGRYIRVQLAGTNFLHLAEVEVYGCAVPQPLNIDCRNVAIAKPATQSSTWSGNTLNFDASNATDANTNGFDENNSITATQNEVQPWWEVDLGESYELTGIKLWNRDERDCNCTDRLSDFYVLSSDVPFTSQDLNTTLAQSGVRWIRYQGTAGRETYLNWDQSARYVRVQLAGTNILTLAEVEVFSECHDQPAKDCEFENFAIGKPTTQSSLWSNNQNFVAAKAIDGNPLSNSITATQEEAQPWWEIDLEEIKDIDQIHFWNRTNCCADRLTDFYVISSPTPFTSTDLTSTLAQAGVNWVHHKGQASPKSIIDWNQAARYVRIQLSGTNILTLAEVEILGCTNSTQNQAPVAVIIANPPIGDLPLPVSFDASGSTDDKGIVSYVWDFGDGNSGNGVTANHAYTIPGNYMASLTVADQEGLTDTKTVEITVTDPNECVLTNVALNKTAQQSSTYPGAVASKAVDGNTNGLWSGGSVANTQNEAQPWWEVDLGEVYFLDNISLWSRTNCCQDRLSDFYVITSELPFTSQDLTTTLNQSGVKTYQVETTVVGELEIPWTENARYLRVQLVGNNFLHLAEVEAMGCTAQDPVVDPPAGGDCFVVSNGEVVIEAEHFLSTTAGFGNASGSSWNLIQDANASGGQAMEAGPNEGVWTGLNTNGPRLDYDIDFEETGNYRIYILTSAPGANDDSYHVGLDGSSVSSNSGYGMGLNGPWAWADFANEDDFVEVNVPSIGKHTFNIWMREDGVQIDKIVISKNGAPSGQGPAESAQTDCGAAANLAPIASFVATPTSGIAPVEVNADGGSSADPDGNIAAYSWNFGDGQTASGQTAKHIYTAAGSYTLKLTVTDHEGLSSESSRIITVSPNGSGPLCHEESNGVVVLEAENYSNLLSGTGNAAASSWEVFEDVNNLSNGSGLRAVPNTGVYTGLEINGPRVDYDITFNTVGTYRIYIRTQGASGEDDSYHVGLNGVAVSTNSGYGMGINGPWAWADFANDDEFVEVVVPTTGQHTFNVWMREDGVEIDKIVLKINPGVPSATGPAESILSACEGQSLSSESFAVEEAGGNANISWGNFFEEFQDNYVLERSIDGVIYEVIEDDEIIVDKMLNEHTDKHIRQYEVNQLFYRLRIRDAYGRTRKQRAGILNLRKSVAAFSFEAYPIPAIDKINVSFDNSSSKELSLTVLNALGQRMYHETLDGQMSDVIIRLDIDSWAQGIYFIQLTDGEENQVVRVLKE